ncbi:MAG: glycosyl transferase family 1, partial [Sulfuricella sp.]|nr:glycosyl transferase family 1 [Sulfuricella sp.]
MENKIRILFIGEAVSLAHVARPLALALALDPARYAVSFAVDPRYNALLGDPPFPLQRIDSIDGNRFSTALARGTPIYDLPTLRRYVGADLDLIAAARPHLVVGDFRLSLTASARVAGVPYFSITNSYWSPYARQRFPLPAHPLAQWLGVAAAQALFRLARPAVFALHARPLNRLRREYGLPALGHDLRRAYTDADHTLYADVPELMNLPALPAHHHFLGPVLWSPSIPLPEWWETLPADKPLVYVTLGSSGPRRTLPLILDALASLPVTAMVAAAGETVRDPPKNVHAASYLPGEAAAARAQLVICNGGSPTSQQALAAGVPVLGIAGNLDQFLNMQAVEA